MIEECREQALEIDLRFLVHLDEAGAGVPGSLGQSFGIAGPEPDLLDGALHEIRRREDIPSRRAEEIADAAAIGGDDGHAAGEGIDDDQRLSLVLVKGREQEDVDILIEAADILCVEAPQIVESLAELLQIG